MRNARRLVVDNTGNVLLVTPPASSLPTVAPAGAAVKEEEAPPAMPAGVVVKEEEGPPEWPIGAVVKEEPLEIATEESENRAENQR